MSRYRLEWFLRPGKTLSKAAASSLVREFRQVGEECLSPLPDYQVFAQTPDALDDKAIVVARRRDGTMAGFHSAVLIDVPGVGEVLHLGLLCVRPEDRGGGLTHVMGNRLALRYFAVRRFRRFWISNVACVLSSLGNFSRHVSSAHPAPGSTPSDAARLIAEAWDKNHRHKAFIQPGAVFDSQRFVFRHSAKGTAFQKSAEDEEFFHRDGRLNEFYKAMLRFEDGDEMLQVGTLGWGDFARHALR